MGKAMRVFSRMELGSEYAIHINSNHLCKFPRAGSGVAIHDIDNTEMFLLAPEFHPFVNPSMNVTVKIPVRVPTQVKGHYSTLLMCIENAQARDIEKFFERVTVLPYIDNDGELRFEYRNMSGVVVYPAYEPARMEVKNA